MLDAAISALGTFLDPTQFLFLAIGVLAGLLVGIIPGLGGTAAVALLLPFVFVLEPAQALALIIGAVAVVHTSDTITAVLLGIPGSASATVLMLDGHEMAKQGQGARALSMAFLSSMAGGILGAIGLTLSIPLARPIVLLFGSPELFMLTVLGISLTALLSRGNIIKGLLAGVFGVLLGQVGAAPAAADYRFTFGSLFLTEGLDLVAVALGIFGIAEVVSLIARKTSIAPQTGIGGGWMIGVREFFANWRHVLRGALVGIWAGVLPGLGATAGTWMAYGQAAATAKGKDKKKFGKGNPRGIIAPESANNSVEAGDLIPTLLFGIPGGAPAALLLGALLVFGVEPGPRIITDDLDIVYTIIWSFALASVLGAALCFLISKPLARLSFVRFPVLGAGLIVIMFVSAFQDSEQFQLLQIMFVLGLVGWLMKVCGFPRAPFLIGFVLAVPLERYYFLTANLYTTTEWITRPGVLVMAAILITPVIFVLVRTVRGKPAPAGPEGGDEGGEPAAPRSWPLGLSIAFLVVFVAALVLSQDFSDRAQLVPQLVSLFGIALSLVSVAREMQAWRTGRARDGGASDGASGAPVAPENPPLSADSGMAAEAGATTRTTASPEAQRSAWRAELGWTAYAFGWLVIFLVLTYLLGVVLAAATFVPVFLWRVAEMRFVPSTLYVSAVIVLLFVLESYAGIALPVGLFTPEVLL